MSYLKKSWVDLSISPGRVTPVAVPIVGTMSATASSTTSGAGTYAALSLVGEEYLRLLKEAQRESNHSSALVSLESSRRDSRCESPKSPPNSPNNEISGDGIELNGVFINKEPEGTKEWVMNYIAARCDVQTKKESQLKSNCKTTLSLRTTKLAGKSLFSKEVLYTLFVSNFLSLFIGAGIGLWLSKRPMGFCQFPLN